jgi:hypothetical protein
MDVDTACVLLVAVLLTARVAFKRDVPMIAFFLCCGAWALSLLWDTLNRALVYAFLVMRLVEYYDREPPSIFAILSSAGYTFAGLVLIVGVLLAARGAPVEAPVVVVEPKKE